MGIEKIDHPLGNVNVIPGHFAGKYTRRERMESLILHRVFANNADVLPKLVVPGEMGETLIEVIGNAFKRLA